MTLSQFISKVQERKEELKNTITSLNGFTEIASEYKINLSVFRGDSALGEIARLMIIRENK